MILRAGLTASLTALLCALPLFAQPGQQILTTFDFLANEQLLDIYTLQDGGYVMCGSMAPSRNFGRPSRGDAIVVRVNRDGATAWNTTLNLAGNLALATSIIEAENGDFVACGAAEDQIIAFRLDPDGGVIWTHNYWEGTGWGVIELKGGDFLICGDHDGGSLIRINGAGEMQWRRAYNPGVTGRLIGLREFDDSIIACGFGKTAVGDEPVPWAVRVDPANGDLEWSHVYPNGMHNYVTYGMTSAGAGGFVMTGTVVGGEGDDGEDFFVLKFDADGEQIWFRSYPRSLYQYGRAITRLSDGGFAIVGESSYYGPPGVNPAVVRIDGSGQIRWESVYHIADGRDFAKGSNMFWGVTTGQHDEIVACGSVNSYPHDDYDGFLMKLAPDLPNVAYLDYTPEDTLFTMLPDSAVTFIAKPRDIDWEAFEYAWTWRDTLRSEDTTVTLPLTDLGVDTIICSVSQDQVSTAIRWRITVAEMFIHSVLPDSFNIQIRRGRTIDFAIDSLATVSLDSIEYVWTLTDLNSQETELVGEDSLCSIIFPRSGNYRVRGVVSRPRSTDAREWTVQVRSAVLDFWPGNLNVTVLEDSLTEFGILAFNPDSDSLSYLWSLDGNNISVDSIVVLSFENNPDRPDPYLLTAIVADGESIDTVAWRISVEIIPSVVDRKPGQPHRFALEAPSPNPFNSRALIRYSLTRRGEARLTLCDLTGREVRELRRGAAQEGTHLLAFEAGDLPAGVYLLLLESGGESLTHKAVILR